MFKAARAYSDCGSLCLLQNILNVMLHEMIRNDAF